ncbi:Hsp20/alpha crystallin family protein [Brockia lithotrophica]|uniref:HSP20 family protein n=1 Tax=Brockia lithotrophica TaxID=933949 RepID=A0A660L6S3_9BACL|nr:Hsp20/alpha crystallin family protein [Brockia lithotrophica]RKQ88924.1 HSP20 family protein [Brockia lithotrophica]
MFGIVPFRDRKRRDVRSVFDEFSSLMDRLLDEDFFLVPFVPRSFRTDIRETEDAYIVEAELPGVPKEAIRVTYDEGVLSIVVEEDKDITEEKGEYIRRERYRGRNERHFALENVDEEKITASFENGVLRITLPKLKRTPPKGREIVIE